MAVEIDPAVVINREDVAERRAVVIEKGVVARNPYGIGQADLESVVLAIGVEILDQRGQGTVRECDRPMEYTIKLSSCFAPRPRA
jgi:hypothetical protein